MRSVKEIREIATAWRELTREIYNSSVGSTLDECNRLEALGEEWGYKIPYDFRVAKGKPYISNSSTHYEFDTNEYYVVWDNGNVGRLQFVSENYYDDVTEEWRQFLAELDSYEPLGSDPYNCHRIYSIENGKRLMNDYAEICKRTREAMNKKVKKRELERLKNRIAKMEAEVDNESM